MKKVNTAEMRAVEGGAPWGTTKATCRACGTVFYKKMIFGSYSKYSAALKAMDGAFATHKKKCVMGGNRGYTPTLLNW